jgi:hypothetical protein
MHLFRDLLRLLLAAPVLAVAVTPTPAQAPKAPAVVELDKASPAGANRKVTATGTYTADDGWKPVSVKVWLIPKGGGRLREAENSDVADSKWGPVTIDDVPAGEYSAGADIVFRHEKKGDVTIRSKLHTVKVP